MGYFWEEPKRSFLYPPYTMKLARQALVKCADCNGRDVKHASRTNRSGAW